jgi:signal transduction histidine kinase
MRSFSHVMGFAFAIWTLLMASLIYAQYQLYERSALAHARSDALSAFRRDTTLRKWASLQGGVYAPITATLQPNPYLRVSNRDVTTSSGQALTLVNPAYLLRLVHQLGEELDGMKGHLTSLKPTRPGNAPDPWERRTLESFEGGKTEGSELASMDGVEYYRLMRPFVAEASCLKCHGVQGYKVGDIRGGITISLPFKPFQTEARGEAKFLTVIFTGIWALGMAGLAFVSRRLRAALGTQLAAEELLREVNSELASSAEEKAQALEAAKKRLARRERDYAGIVSDLKEAQGRLLESEKLHALGVIVPGIAHEINTPLGAIASSRVSSALLIRKLAEAGVPRGLELSPEESELLHSFAQKCEEACDTGSGLEKQRSNPRRVARFVAERGLDLSEAIVEGLDDISPDFELEPYLPLFRHEKREELFTTVLTLVDLLRCNAVIGMAAEKASHEIKTLSMYAANEDGASGEAFVTELIEEVLALFAPRASPSLRVLRSYESSPMIHGRLDQLHQAFYNLIDNALEAVNYEGTLGLSVSESGGFVCVGIENDGPPIPQALKGKIFKPFFTTKGKGEGTGLGLFLVKRIVEEEGGSVSFSSDKEKTVFNILLPATGGGS